MLLNWQKYSTPFYNRKTMIPKSLRKTCVEMNKTALVFEAGESKRLDSYSIKTGLQGIKNILIFLGMIDGQSNHNTESIVLNKSSWIRGRDSGIINLHKHAGDKVTEKETIAVIKDISNEWSKNVKARRSGYIIGHNNAPVINMGDPIFNIAWNDKE
ncbi:MAG: succinylglutamate desuccinylase/aspartoacylase family protein [Saprospiraceae bacterium]